MQHIIKGLFILTGFWLLIGNGKIRAQEMPAPFSEARKAIEATQKAPIIRDSLMRSYAKKWSVGLSFGHHFISQANEPDTITFVDFTDRTGTMGIIASYFWTQRLQLTLEVDVTILPEDQSINSVIIGGGNGIRVEGSGDGGAMIKLGIGGKYFFKPRSTTRPYLGAEFGQIRTIAVGGKGGFTLGQGRYEEVTRRQKTYQYIQPGLGMTHRFSPIIMIDFNMGYLLASRSENIGRITSPAGITIATSLQFLIGNKAH
ncbi:MAG: hypothetical protein RIG62_22205 [Cyclobacteriaceae bacterium]